MQKFSDLSLVCPRIFEAYAWLCEKAGLLFVLELAARNCIDCASILTVPRAVLKYWLSPNASDCSITLNNVTSNRLTLSRQPALFARVSAFVLLVLVAYGAVAGAAHNHGNADLRLQAGITEPAYSNPGDADSSTKKLPDNDECLICQLQHNLFSGLLNALPQVAPPPTEFAFATQLQQPSSSQTLTPRRGRAPPTSLS